MGSSPIRMNYSCDLESPQLHPSGPNHFQFEQTNATESIDSNQIQINTKYVLDDGRVGMCVFVGHTLFARGIWIGLVFENDGDGNCNGTINNKQYFLCGHNRGLFIKKEKIIKE